MRATLALLNMPRTDAESVDAAVQQWASSGEGVVHAGDGGVFLLYVDVGGGSIYVVEFFLEPGAETMHVERVRRP
jgi:hypothetical protein